MSGLGVYPGDPCYDPARPTWLAYWLDDFTESDCKYNASNIGEATLNAFANPDVVAQNVGGVVGQGGAAVVSDFTGAFTQAGTSFFQNLDTSGWLAIAAVAVGAFLIFGAFKR